ncbi:MAG: hypothetical protein TR69_WS6001000083 [candidate division WS6 bacterium OLB20]|uniref:Uncharacterized protein n=1 Tax=candidate division WS6 bacterium OLB20 TaxID=1617426 RepID=A0A136M166_9BACT|nr:MAG: hypothetical protein TR69_WS6001000083 [candidate division WS6 bacterium OLB20]
MGYKTDTLTQPAFDTGTLQLKAAEGKEASYWTVAESPIDSYYNLFKNLIRVRTGQDFCNCMEAVLSHQYGRNGKRPLAVMNLFGTNAVFHMMNQRIINGLIRSATGVSLSDYRDSYSVNGIPLRDLDISHAGYSQVSVDLLSNEAWNLVSVAGQQDVVFCAPRGALTMESVRKSFAASNLPNLIGALIAPGGVAMTEVPAGIDFESWFGSIGGEYRGSSSRFAGIADYAGYRISLEYDRSRLNYPVMMLETGQYLHERGALPGIA